MNINTPGQHYLRDSQQCETMRKGEKKISKLLKPVNKPLSHLEVQTITGLLLSRFQNSQNQNIFPHFEVVNYLLWFLKQDQIRNLPLLCIILQMSEFCTDPCPVGVCHSFILSTLPKHTCTLVFSFF